MAQITTLYQPEDLRGKQVAAVVNFPPKQIAGFMSGLLLGAMDGGDVILLQPERDATNGLRVG